MARNGLFEENCGLFHKEVNSGKSVRLEVEGECCIAYSENSQSYRFYVCQEHEVGKCISPFDLLESEIQELAEGGRWDDSALKKRVEQEIPRLQSLLTPIGKTRMLQNPPLEQSSAAKKPREVILFTDFDGTLTAKEGQETVSSAFYRSLFEDKKSQKKWNYAEARMKSSGEVQALLKNQHDLDRSFFIEDAAVFFLHEVLKKPDIKVNIVTRNREEYIVQLLIFQGFSGEELTKLTILDVSNGLTKAQLVDRQLSPLQEQHWVYVFDDSKEDFNAMLKVVMQKNNGNKATVKGVHEAAGAFNWAMHQADINRYSAPVTPGSTAVGTGGSQQTTRRLSDQRKMHPNRSSHFQPEKEKEGSSEQYSSNQSNTPGGFGAFD